MKPFVVLFGVTICLFASTANGAVVLEPDDYEEGADLTHVLPQVTLTTAGRDNLPIPPVPFVVRAMTSTPNITPPTGTKIFAHEGVPFFPPGVRLRMNFNGLVSDVAIDFQGSSSLNTQQGTLVAFDSNGTLVDSFMSNPLLAGQFQTMSIHRSFPDIAWAVAYTAAETSPFGRLDHLTFSTPVPEPSSLALLGSILIAVLLARRRFIS